MTLAHWHARMQAAAVICDRDGHVTAPVLAAAEGCTRHAGNVWLYTSRRRGYVERISVGCYVLTAAGHAELARLALAVPRVTTPMRVVGKARRLGGQCFACGRAGAPEHYRCDACRPKVNAYMRQYRARRRARRERAVAR